MASEKAEKKEKKKDKKEKKSKHETDGVTKSKSDKKEKKKKLKDVGETMLDKLQDLTSDGLVAVVNGDNDDEDADVEMGSVVPVGALVPFANPLADEKQTKKLLKAVKKAAKNKTLKRGVKEVVKSLRKSPNSGPSSSGNSDPIGVVIIAADISPMDVISHIPVLCEDHNIPYIYVTSRAELGAAGNTKRATSVVLITKERTKKPGKEAEEVDEDYAADYADLVKLVQKAGKNVRV